MLQREKDLALVLCLLGGGWGGLGFFWRVSFCLYVCFKFFFDLCHYCCSKIEPSLIVGSICLLSHDLCNPGSWESPANTGGASRAAREHGDFLIYCCLVQHLTCVCTYLEGLTSCRNSHKVSSLQLWMVTSRAMLPLCPIVNILKSGVHFSC